MLRIHKTLDNHYEVLYNGLVWDRYETAEAARREIERLRANPAQLR